MPVNGRPGVAESFDALDALLSEQHYRLAFWRVAADEVNYRLASSPRVVTLAMPRPAT